MPDSTVRYEEQGAGAIATLNRPQSPNSFNRRMHHDLRAVPDRAEASDTIRALVIAGPGRGFSAAMGATHDCIEAVTAFPLKHAAVFTGR